MALQAWAAEARRQAMEMRLRALSMRVFTKAMRANPCPAAPGQDVPEPGDMPMERAVQAAAVAEQAKGVLAARFACTLEQAQFLLHEHSRRTGLPVTVLARQVVRDHGLTT
ncbi:ANTAR domain-containing protein [Streptomyces sp. PA5.6]|uniref:ANTAR domain-containing protein n=1 Tax=Streptomyces sp. PA5.6 TaxID=3035651 RepID=UPI003904A708